MSGVKNPGAVGAAHGDLVDPNFNEKDEANHNTTNALEQDNVGIHDADDGPTVKFTSLASWHDRPIKPAQWTVENRIPARNVTLLSGEGGSGKTTLAQQLCIAGVAQKDWLGVVPQFTRAMIMCCEDDEDEVHRRFHNIALHYHVPLQDLGNLYVRSYAGKDALLARLDPKTKLLKASDLYYRILEAVEFYRPGLLVVDNAADTFGGDENDRLQVRNFITLLRSIALQTDCAVLLTSHPSLTGLASGTGLSGSTAWHNSVRARMYMKKPKPEAGDRIDPGERVLDVMKSNYGPAGESVRLVWKNGLFLPVDQKLDYEDGSRAKLVDDMFLKLVARFAEQGRNVSHKKTAPTNAPAEFAKDPVAEMNSIRKKEFEFAMARLFYEGRIRVVDYGRPSRPAQRIELVPH